MVGYTPGSVWMSEAAHCHLVPTFAEFTERPPFMITEVTSGRVATTVPVDNTGKLFHICLVIYSILIDWTSICPILRESGVYFFIFNLFRIGILVTCSNQ